jgi:hypothetical protein
VASAGTSWRSGILSMTIKAILVVVFRVDRRLSWNQRKGTKSIEENFTEGEGL